MRFLEVPALITEDIEDPDIVDITETETVTASISGTTLTIDGDSKVSGEVTITLTGDVTVSTVTTSNIRQPSIHKIIIKTNGAGNFTYMPNNTVTASSVSTTTKTGSDLDILLITTSGGDTYLDLDLADYVSPAANFSNVLTGFNVSELTSAYGTTAKLFKPDGTLLTTVNSPATGSGVNFGYTESSPGDVIYKLEVTDDVGRKSKYNLPRKWINYAMETTSTPGFQKFALSGNDYTSTVTLPSLGSSSKARVHKTTDHGYMGINFKIQGRNSTSGAWVDVDDTGENENADESAEFLAFGDYLYHRVWVKPTAKATTTVSSSNVVTLTLSNVTEDVTTKTITGADPFEIDETSNVFVFEEPTKIGSVPFTVTVGTETYTNAVTATTVEVGSTPNTDMTAAGPNMKHEITVSSLSRFHEVSADGKFIAWSNQSGVIQVMKGDPVSGYTNYATFTHSQSTKNDLFGSISYDGKYIINGCNGVNQNHEIWKHDESAGTYTKISQTAPEIGSENRLHKPSFIPRSGNYDFAVTGTDNNSTFRIQLYKHSAGTDTWTAQTEIVDPTNKPTGDSNRGRYGKQFTQDGKYLMVSSTGSYGGYEMYTIDWDANTAVFSGANRAASDNIGHSGTVTLDGKYVLLFHNDSNSRLIFKNNDAGDWSSATDVTSDFTFEDTDNDQGHDISFCGEKSEYFLSGMRSGNLRMYSWYANKGATLAFTNPTLSLTTSDVTISSAKLYRDDVLFHTYGTESNVVLRSDQTGTYQAIVNDVYYSNRVTPDFTTTRSVSAPQLGFDGYNKLTLANYTTTTSDFPSIITFDASAWSGAPTTIWYVLDTTKSTDTSKFYEVNAPTTGDAGNDGTNYGIEFRCESDGTTKVYANTDDNTSQPNTLNVNSTAYQSNYVDGVTVTSGDVLYGVESSFTRFGFNVTSSMLFTRTVITPTSTTLGLPDGTTRDLTTQSNVYIYETGTYTANVQTSDTFAYLSNVVTSQPSQHPTDVGPTLTFDGFNKLSIENITQTSSTITYPNDSTVSTNAVSDVYIKDIGEYVLEASDANTFVTSNVEVGALDTVPGFTAAFHHGAFSASDYSSAYSTVAEAATAGYVYSDTPAGEYTWGTLAHVKERENPDFTANSTLHTDYSSTYGWTMNSGWEVSAKDTLSSTYEVWNAFNKGDGASNNNWLSGSAPSTSSPQWLKIKYPSSQVIKSYVIRARENTSPRFPTAWKLQGANTDIGDTDTGWTDIGTEQTQTEWVPNQNKSFDLSTNTTAYQYYRLRITGAKESASSDNSDYVAIGQWFLNTVNEENTTNHDQYTSYTYTPSQSLTGVDYLIVGGGGGGEKFGNNWKSAGGGAGGFLCSVDSSGGPSSNLTPVSLTNTSHKIIVGSGGAGGGYDGAGGSNGNDSSFNGLTAKGGGGGGSGGVGGSGGGDSANNNGHYNDITSGGNGTAGQGNAGGDTGDTTATGGGGAGGASSSSAGGVGVQTSIRTGTLEYFAGGGGASTSGQGGLGGGGNGGDNGTDGEDHKGGGGGGSKGVNTPGSGGSGIVIIRKLGATNPPALNFDGYNKLSIDNFNTSAVNFTDAAITGTAQHAGKISWSSDNKLTSSTTGGWVTARARTTIKFNKSTIAGIQFRKSRTADYWNIQILTPDDTETWMTSSTADVILANQKPFIGNQNGTQTYNVYSGGYSNQVGTKNYVQDDLLKIYFDDSKIYSYKNGVLLWENAVDSYYTSNSEFYIVFGSQTASSYGLGNVYDFDFVDSSGNVVKSSEYSATIKKDGAAFATTTSNTVYIRDEGTYTAEVTGLDAYVTEVSKVVSGDITEFPNYVNATSFYYGGGVVDNTGKLYTWGHDGYGDSGRGASDRVPTHVSSISDPVSNVWRGDPGFTMAAKTSTDKWYMWGRNTYSGVLGNTTNTGNVTTPEDVTAKVTTYFGDQTVSANKILKIVMGEHHAAALTAGGKVWSWGGDATYYATGTGTNDNTVLVTPVKLTTFGDYGGKTNITIGGSGDFSSGKQYILDTSQSDSTNKFFEMYTTADPPVAENASYGISLEASNDVGGGVRGQQVNVNSSGNAGNPATVKRTRSGVTVSGNNTVSYVVGDVITICNNEQTAQGTFTITSDMVWSLDDLSGITEIQSTYHGVAALDSSGNVWFWGGASTSMQYAYPTKLLDSSSIPGIVGMATNGKSIYAWKSDGTFYTRGAGTYGQLANGASSDQYTSWQTVTTLQGKTIKRVFGGNENMFVWTDDGVYGAGRGNNYKNGDGGTGNNILFDKSTTLSALSIKEIDFGHATGLVLTTDGRGYMWGEDASNSMANALSGHQSGAAEATSISALSLVHIPSPSITYDGKNKLTVNGTNYADTATVTYYSNTYNLGTAKTMYVKDAGEYVFKISGTDKYVESNVHVSSVDLAGAPTKPIDFDGYNKLTLISPGENVVSNVTYFSNTYELGSANVLYINGAGTYNLEMSGSNVFALSNTVMGTLSTDKYDYSQSSSGQQKITASDGSSTEYFGRRCAISGDKMVVTASSDNSHQGAAYIFTKSGTTWSEQQKLTGSGLSSSTEPQFGHGADISGNYAIVGAYEEDTDGANAGGAYIFNFSGGTWTQQARIVSSDIAAGDAFGYAVGIDGDYAIVGAQSADPGGSSNSGAAYIFKKESTYVFTGTSPSTITLGGFWYTDFSRWYQKSTSDATSSYVRYILWNSSGQVGANYGTSFYTNSSGDLILDVNDSTGGSSTPFYFVNNTTSTTVSSGTGVVSVGDSIELFTSLNTSEATFTVPSVFAPTSGDVWSQQAKLTASDAVAGDDFGRDVAIKGDYVIVGCYSGEAAYIFKKDTGAETWTQKAILTASDAGGTDYFGDNVSMSGDYVIVGAKVNDSSKGAAYIFMKDTGAETWTQQAKLIASDAANSDQFGWSVSIDNDLAIVGSLNDDDGGSSSGSAYVFARDGTNWSQQVKLTASDAAASDVFGNSVAIDGDFAVVGARGDASGTGAAYIFQGVKSFPSLTFDNYNKLTLENFTRPTLSDVNSTNVSATKVAGGGTSPDASSINSHVVLSNGDKAYHYNYTNDTNHVRNLFDNNTSTKAHGTSLSAGEYYEWGYEFVSSKKIGSMTFKTWTQGDTVGNISIYYYDGTTWKSVVNPSALGYDLATEPASYAELEITFSPVTATHFKIWVYAHPQSSSSNTPCISEWTLKSYRDGTLTDPNGDTYSLGQTQNDIYIKDQGDYILEVTNSDQSAVVKTNVTGSIDTSVLNEVSNVSGSSSFASGINTTGFSFSSDGNRVVIGEPESHKIHIYNYINNTWTLDKTVTKNNNFGSSVVISKNGNKIIACKKQVAYLFINGVETASIQPADCTTTFGQSGLSISNDGNYVVVGDYSHGSDTGKVYVYDISNNSFSVSTSMNGTSVGDSAGKTTLLNKDGTRLFYTEGSVIKIYQRTNSTWQSTTSISVSGSISIDEDGDRIAVGESDPQSGTIYLRQKYQNSWSGIINYKSGVGLSQWVQTVNTEWTQTNGSAAWGWPISNNNSANAYLPWNGRWYKFTSPTELYEFTGDGTVNNTQVPDENTTGTAKTTTDTVDGITYYRIHRANDSYWGEHLLVARFVQDGSGIDDRVTIYVRNSSNGTFSLEQTITGVSGDAYGSSVSLNGGGDKLFIGSKNNGSGKGLIEYWTKDSSNTWNKKRDDIVGETTTDKIGDYIATNLLGSVLGTHSSNDKLFIYNSDSPSLNFDNYIKLSVENLTPNSSSLRFGSNTYEIGTASNVYIEHEGTYKMATGDANTFALVSKQVNTLALKPDYTNIYAGEYGGMVIDSDGKLYTWGNDGNNQSGRGASDRTPTHISTISDPVSNVWVEGAAGRTRIVKTSTDKWYMWGMNLDKYKIFGQTGDQATPVDVTSDFTTYFGAQGTSDSTRIIKVVTSASACSALAADGKVWSWGVDGNRNELGKNTTNGTTATPFKNTTDGSTELSNITDIRSLHYGKLALDSNGDVWQWGTLRTGSTGYPTKQTGLDTVTIIGIGAGYFTAYAWDATGTIYSIGQGTEGQLGNGANVDHDSTWQTVTTLQGKTIYGIYGAGYSVFAHTSDGVYACGQGTNGRLGMGDNNNLNVFTKSTTLSALSIYKLDFGHGPGYVITTDGKGYALGYDYLNSIPTPLSGDKNVPTEASSLTNLSLVYQPPSLTYDTSNKLSIENLTPTSTTLTDPNGSSFDIGTASNVYIRDSGKYSIASKDANTFVLTSNTVTGTPTGTTYVYDSNTFTTPSQTYDNTKTITVTNVPSTVTDVVGKIYKGATAYTIHATEPTSNVIIKNTGSYVSVFTTSNIAYLTNTVNVNATPTTTSDDTTIEDATPIVTTTTSTSVDTILAFHYGSFDTVYGDADVEEAANNGRIFDDTPSSGTSYTWGTLDSTPSTASNQTTYTWTPTSDITGADVLMVAGGGGGGKQVGGGGGAGGLLHHTNQTLSGQKTIVVGDGGIGGDYTLNGGASNGNNTTFTGFDDDAIAGGRGASYSGFGSGTGGSGGGGGGNSTTGQTGTSGQGNSGGSGRNNSWAGGGGGGAGAAGQGSPSNNVGGYGGAGLDKSSVFGTTYGDSGWFAGGGGGCASTTNTVGAGGQGGGGQGGNTAHVESGVRKAGTKHTGGGGGGTRDGNNFSGGSVSYALSQDGGKGGSGIVLVKFTTQVTTTTTTGGLAGSTAVPTETTTDAPSVTLDATDTTVTDPILDLDFTTTLPRNLKRYNTITSSSIGARFNRTESKKKRVHKSINTDTFSIELTANNMGDSSWSTSTLPVTVVNSGAGTQYMSGWTTGSTSSFAVPSDAPNALYYYSQNDDSAGGSISVSSASTTAYTVTVVSSSAGTQYTSGWATTPSPTYVPGVSGAESTFAAPNNAPNTLYYYCGNHSGMGGAINMVSGPVSSTFAVTVQSVSYGYSSSDKYFIDGTQQATISLVRGKTYTFNNNASGNHPMYITTSSDGATYNYPPGGWNDGSSTVTFVVPMDAPSTLYYKCNNHNGMGGTINILGPTASPLEVTVSGGKFVINDDSQVTLQLVRGETYVFNQEDDSNETHPIRLSETSNGTHVTGGSGFYIGGTQRPTLTMVRGNTYTFDQTNASNGSHVLQIATASDGTQYTSGYTTGTFVVPLSAPDTLYYKSSTTSGMGGLINVTGSTTSAFVVTFSGGKFSIGGVQQASLSVIRGLTYTFDQTESTNSTHVLLLSSTSDGTRNTGVNKYYISGVETPTLTFIRGNTYTFDQSDDTNTNHPIRLSETSNGEHASGSPSQYTSGWTTTPASDDYVPGVSGATSQFEVPADAPSTLYYYCQHHSGMGGTGFINVADSNSGIILTYGTHALVANSTVSGEYTIATNYDGTTSNLYVNGDLITQTTPTIASGAKMIKIGEDYNGLIKNLKFWNYAKRFFIPDGSSEHKAGYSANQIKNLTGTTTNGLYWILVNNVATQLYCDMNTIDGGGWTLIGKSNGTFNDPNNWLKSSIGTMTDITNTETYACIDAREIAGTHSSECALSSVDLTKWVKCDFHSGCTSATIFNHSDGQSVINTDASTNSESVTATAWNGGTTASYVNKYSIMPWSSHGGSTPSWTMNAAGNTATNDYAMSVSCATTDHNGFTAGTTHNGMDAPYNTTWPNSSYNNSGFVGFVWVR